MTTSENQHYEMTYKKHFIDDKNFQLGTIWSVNDEIADVEQYKQVLPSAKLYLKQEKLTTKENHTFPIYNMLDAIIHTNKKEGFANTWNGLASAFLLFTWYTLQVLRAPWRKSYLKIKTYTGHFQHRVYGNFPPAVGEHLMERMGYIYHESQQAFVFKQQTWPEGTWRDALTRVGMDFFLAHAHCVVAATRTNAVTLSSFKPAKIESPPPTHVTKKTNKSEAAGKEKVLLRPQNFDERFEKLTPNYYATMDEMQRHNRSRDASLGDLKPWHHRARGGEEEVIPINDRGDAELSILDAKVRYPPQIGARVAKNGSKDVRRKATSQSKATPTNYVQAQPMSRLTDSTPRNDRVESGYYSEWALNKLVLCDKKKQTSSGDPMAALPPNRHPGDGEPTASFHTYHEIPDFPRLEGARHLQH